MKKLLILLSMLPLASFAQKPQTQLQKVKSICIATLKKNLNDPGSYSPASWGALKEQQTSFYDSDKYQHLLKDQIETEKQLREINEDLKLQQKKKEYPEAFGKPNEFAQAIMEISNKKLKTSLDSILKKKDTESNFFKPTFRNYYIEHSFRARNKQNGLILITYYFKLTKDLKIIDYGDIESL